MENLIKLSKVGVLCCTEQSNLSVFFILQITAVILKLLLKKLNQKVLSIYYLTI